MQYVFALTAALILNATANLLMKAGMNTVAASGGVLRDGIAVGIKTVLTSLPLVIGLTCFGLNAALYMYALQSKTLKISIAYPIMVGGGYALIAIVARLHPALAERLTWGQAAGVSLVLIGIILIASQGESAAA
jgi:multidrug transporter EmrE-like cation transporter